VTRLIQDDVVGSSMLKEEGMLVDLEPDSPGWETALSVVRELRPQLTGELLAQVLNEGGRQGLRFTARFEHERCVAVAGWRVVANTSSIRKL
jgi:hypothetical protein